MADLGIAGAAVAKQFHRVNGFKCIRFEVDDVNPLRGILENLFHGDVDPEIGLPGRDQYGIVVVDAVNRTRSQSRHQTHESVSAADSGRPAKLVVTERNAGASWKKIFADLLTHDFLNHDAHLFVNIQRSEEHTSELQSLRH